jgi:acetyl-CoA acetyltransferase
MPSTSPSRYASLIIVSSTATGVALILPEAGRVEAIAAKSGKAAYVVQGVGRADFNRGATSLEPRLLDFYRPAQPLATEQVYKMMSLGPTDVGAVPIYDSFSAHVPFALESFGYCLPGDALPFIAWTGVGLDRKLPINTSGGHLWESCMQGWNLDDAVRR